MLIDFSVNNFLSFGEKTSFSLVASGRVSEHKETHTAEWKEGNRLLKSAVVYGPNASGKTNFVKALAFFKNMVISSANLNQDLTQTPPKFLSDAEAAAKPTEFSINFLADYEGVLTPFNYSFSMNEGRIFFEELKYFPKNKLRPAFKRTSREYSFGNTFIGGKSLREKTRENTLFLTVAAQFNNKIALAAYKWFMGMNTMDNIDHPIIANFAHQSWSNPGNYKYLIKYLQVADPSLMSLSMEKSPFNPETIPQQLPQQLRDLIGTSVKEQLQINTAHYGKSKKISYSLQLGQESKGTNVMFRIAPLIYNTLKNGGIFVVDEFGATLHPLLGRFIIDLFNSSANGKNAQLILTTHSTEFLNKVTFRRDQIWFMEKNSENCSELFSLADYKSKAVRKDSSYTKDYLSGKYGALPYIDPTF